VSQESKGRKKMIEAALSCKVSQEKESRRAGEEKEEE
jgi:hypothetical protein